MRIWLHSEWGSSKYSLRSHRCAVAEGLVPEREGLPSIFVFRGHTTKLFNFSETQSCLFYNSKGIACLSHSVMKKVKWEKTETNVSKPSKMKGLLQTVIYHPWLQNAPCVRRPEASSWNSQLSVSLAEKSIVFRQGARPPSGDTGMRVESHVPQRTMDIESYHVCCCWWRQARQRSSWPSAEASHLGWDSE